MGLCDPHIQLLVLAEFDEHDEAESFVLALQTMDSAVRTFEAMLLMRCNSFERPWCEMNVAALEASCTDNTRSSRCTVLNCSSGIDWPEILPVVANMVSGTFTHVLYIAAGHRVDVTDLGSFLSGTMLGYDVLAPTVQLDLFSRDRVSDELIKSGNAEHERSSEAAAERVALLSKFAVFNPGSWCASFHAKSCPRPMCSELVDYWLSLDFSLDSTPASQAASDLLLVEHRGLLSSVNRTWWRSMQADFFHYRRSRWHLFEYAICGDLQGAVNDAFVDLEAVNWGAVVMTLDVFVNGFIPVRTEAAEASAPADPLPWHDEMNKRLLALRWKVGGYSASIATQVVPTSEPASNAQQRTSADECIFISGGLEILDRESCKRTIPARKTVARRMLSSGIDLQAREAVATSRALAGRGCVMPTLTSLPLLLKSEDLALLPQTDVLAEQEFKTCAVVGASGHVLGRGFGAEIDAHDAVIRFNMHAASPSVDLGRARSAVKPFPTLTFALLFPTLSDGRHDHLLTILGAPDDDSSAWQRHGLSLRGADD